MSNSKLVLYIASSVDGIIAKPNDNLDFLKLVEQEGEDYGYFDFISDVDAVIVGRKTYEWVEGLGIDYPHKDKPVFVFTSKQRPKEGQVTFYNDSLSTLVAKLKKESGTKIYCDGGAHLVNSLLKEKLIDEIILSIIPVILGEGNRLFKDGFPEQELKLVSSNHFKTGLVQNHYRVL